MFILQITKPSHVNRYFVERVSQGVLAIHMNGKFEEQLTGADYKRDTTTSVFATASLHETWALSEGFSL